MTNLQKRILTSLIILPLSFFFVVKGGYYLFFFLTVVFFIANFELFTVFNKRSTILILDLILILSLLSVYYLAKGISLYILLWVITLCICSDTGGYIFGKIFKWKKLTKISPKKTVSGALGSFVFSLFSVFIIHIIASEPNLTDNFLPMNSLINFLDPKYFFLAIIFSLVAQAGDLTISYFKRLEKIKDTGKILPGHGGIFDRFDSLMFVVIFAFILINLNVFW